MPERIKVRSWYPAAGRGVKEVREDRGQDLDTRTHRAAHRPRDLGAPHAAAVANGNFGMAEPAARGPDLHLDRPAEILVPHPEGHEGVVADGAERSEVGVPRSVQGGEETGREPVPEPRVRGEGARLALPEDPGAHH